MNTLFLTLLYDPDDVTQVRSLTRGSMQNQINTYQWAFIDGLRMNMGSEEKLQIVNALPVGIFPLHTKHLHAVEIHVGAHSLAVWINVKLQIGNNYAPLVKNFPPQYLHALRQRAFLLQ